MRVLAVGSARFEAQAVPATPRDIAFQFVGLIGFADPLRATVPPPQRDPAPPENQMRRF